jgi:hypothetical protein
MNDRHLEKNPLATANHTHYSSSDTFFSFMERFALELPVFENGSPFNLLL